MAGRARTTALLSADHAAPNPSTVAGPITGRARMSYRRAAEIFTTVTRPLDPAGRGWTLHQLGQAGRAGAGTGQELR